MGNEACDGDVEYDNFYGAVTQHMPLQERLEKNMWHDVTKCILL